jgi:hypothetical protein
MKRTRSHRAPVIALLLAAVGCDGAGTPEARNAQSVAPNTEALRVQASLDARYAASEVRHSFRTKLGETVDCIDFFAQPGVKALAALGQPITKRPPAAPKTALTGPLAALAFDGSLDEDGNQRACPDGDVPIMRLTADDIARAGGIDAVEHAHARKGHPLMSTLPKSESRSGPPDIANYAHVTTTFNQSTVTSGGSILSYFDPPVPNNGSHDISQIWMYTGNGFNIGGQTCTTNCIQSIEAGINVDPSLYGDGALHFFIFSTNDGYKTGCYNNNSNTGTCVPFVVLPNAQFTPGQILTTTGTPTGSDQSARVQITMKQLFLPIFGGLWINVGWDITLAGSEVGYYPIANFSGTMKSSASTFQAGGEVDDQTNTWVVPMGNGASPLAGQASSHTFYSACTGMSKGTATNCSFDFSAPSSTVPSAYGLNPGALMFYYGDVSGIFWPQDYGDSFSPVGDWDPGYYKGQCGSGQPLDGLSKFPNSTTAHAVHCSETSASPGGNGCYRRLASNVDNRGDNDNGWDWDPGSAKTECNAGEYVEGVAQYTNGAGVHSVLCCPSNVRHAFCDAQIFYTQDSSAYPGTDWDPTYLKGQCPSGQYVAGISSPGAAWAGTQGAPHGILCCSP